VSDLFHRYLDGQASDAETEALSAALRSDAAARTEYLRLADLHARLAIDPVLWSASREPVRRQPGLLARAGWPVAVATLLLLLVSRSSKPDVATERFPVATLLAEEAAVWSGRILDPGSRLDAGTFKLRSGRAALRLDGGTKVLFTGPADVRLETAGRVRLLRGEAQALVPEEASGFTMAVPGGEAIGLASEFVASVSGSGVSEITVVEGDVDVGPRGGSGEMRRVAAGAAIRVGAGGEVAEGMVRLPADTFVEAVGTMVQRKPVQPAAVVERFATYVPGDYQSGELSGGTGWCGPWTWLTDAAGKRISSGNVKVISIGSLASRQGWVTQPQVVMRQRRLCRPIDLGQDGVHYLSMRCFEPPLDATGNASEDRGRTIILDLKSVDATVREHVGLRVDYLGRPTLETGMGQGIVSPARMPDGELLLVGKIVSRRSREDEVFLRVFPAGEEPPLWEPDTWHVVSSGLFFDAVLDHAVVNSRGPVPRRIDEIRIGSTWQEIAHAP
jgi:ferric-dicitrate binding protein FerR (iron transport regulator)